MPRDSGTAISIVQLARLLGISKTTVHAALTGSAPVSARTRERVLAAADAHGYRPNLLAQALRTRRTDLIGVVTHVANTQLFDDFMLKVDQDAAVLGFRMLSAGSFNDAQRERDLLELYLSIGVEGILLYPVPSDENRALLAEVARRAALVLIEIPLPDLPADLVGPDHFATGVLATRHLLHRGCRRVAFLRPSSPSYADWWVTARQRGCDQALADAGLPPSTTLGRMQPMQSSHEVGGRQGVETFLAAGGDMDGLFAANDTLAYGAIAALKDAGWRVPEDVAVIGCDDLATSATCDPPLTSMRPPMHALGAAAFALLMHRMRREEPAPPRQILLPSALVPRTSG